MSGSGLNSHGFERQRAHVPALPAVVLALALTIVAVGGCDGRRAAVPTPEEKVLHIYNWADYIGFDTIARFEHETHIKVVYDTYDSNEVLEAKLLAGQSGYDIVSTTTSFYERQIKAGVYLALDRSKLPNWRHLDPAVLAIQAQGDPGNRHAMPYLHAMNGFAYNVDMIKARMPDAPVNSLAMLFDPSVTAKFADCGITFLDSPEDVLQLALAYLHRDPNSSTPADLTAAQNVVMAIRRYIRTFDSQDYWHQLASKEVCLSVAWSSDYSNAQLRAAEDGTGAHLAFTLPSEGSNITYNALLIPAAAPHPDAAHRFLNFILEPSVIARITNDIHYGNDNLSAIPLLDHEVAHDPAIYPPQEQRAQLYLPVDLGPEYARLRTRAWTRIKTGQ